MSNHNHKDRHRGWRVIPGGANDGLVTETVRVIPFNPYCQSCGGKIEYGTLCDSCLETIRRQHQIDEEDEHED